MCDPKLLSSQCYGLLGHPLTHSASPAFFRARFKAQGRLNSRYELFDVPTLDELEVWLRAQTHIQGFNVTTPFKIAICAHLGSLSPLAVRIGAVNAVVRTPKGWMGYNTDYGAFLQTLALLPADCLQHPALVLGTGGAARAIITALRDKQIPYTQLSRTPSQNTLAYEQLQSNPSQIHHYRLIVNATPLGMYPDTQHAPPIPYAHLTPAHSCYDLIYNPPQPSFLRLATKQHCFTMNGEKMFRAQAEATGRLWGCWE